MLVKLFPRTYRRYLSLPLFGPVMDDFDDCLLEQGYARSTRSRLLLPNVAQVDRQLRRRGVRHIQDLTPLSNESGSSPCDGAILEGAQAFIIASHPRLQRLTTPSGSLCRLPATGTGIFTI